MMAASGKGVFLPWAESLPSLIADLLIALNLREPRATIEVHVGWRRVETSSTIFDFIETTRLCSSTCRRTDMRNFRHRSAPCRASQPTA